MKLLILHGWTYSPQETWQPLLSLLAEKKIDFEFLKIPGLSDGTDPVWTVNDYLVWLKMKIGDSKVILYGHSNGGRISLAFSASYPQQVAKLILEDSAGIPPSGLRKVKRVVFRGIAKLGGFLTHSEKIRAVLYKMIRESDYKRASPNMRKTMSNLVELDVRKHILSEIKAPTLIIWGAHDKTTPLKSGEAMQRGIHRSRMIILPEARHSPHITHPQQVADAIVAFLHA